MQRRDLKSIESPSGRRRDPFCPLYGECGGCQYQHFAYEEQLKLKEEAVREALHRLSRKGDFEILPIIPSPTDRGYRIRAQMKAWIIAGKRVLGFYAWRTHQVVSVQDCPLLRPLANRILFGLNRYMRERKEIPLKGADVQVSPDEDRGVVSRRVEGRWDNEEIKEIGGEVPEIKGIIVEGKEGACWSEPSLWYKGPEMGGKRLLLQAAGKSFVQDTPDQNRNLIEKVLEWAGLKKDEKAVDLVLQADDFRAKSGTLELAKQQGLGYLQIYFTAFPDHRFGFTDFEENGDLVRCAGEETGTHLGTLGLNPFGMPLTLLPTGKTFKLPKSEFTFRMAGDKVTYFSEEAVKGCGLAGILEQ